MAARPIALPPRRHSATAQTLKPPPIEGRPILTRTRTPGKSLKLDLAETLADPVCLATVVSVAFGKMGLGEMPLEETVEVITAKVRAVQSGDLRGPEGVLVAQTEALNAIFTECARRAAVHLNSDNHAQMPVFERAEAYLRLALRAQAQCRTTIETLAVIKNPPVFARQANFAAGPQQVNNTTPPARGVSGEKPPNELLEAHVEAERLERSAAGTTGASDRALAPVGALHRATHGRRKSPIGPQR